MSTPPNRFEQLISKQANHQWRKSKPTGIKTSVQKRWSWGKRLKWIRLTASRSRLIFAFPLACQKKKEREIITSRLCYQIVKHSKWASRGKRLASDPVTLMGVSIFLFISHLIETLKISKIKPKTNDSAQINETGQCGVEISCGLMSRTWASPWGVWVIFCASTGIKKENDDIFGFYAYRSLLVHLHK